MLRKIKLYGALAKFVGHRVLEADVATAAEAVRFLVTNWPELEGHMAQQYYRVHTAGEDLALDDIHNPMGREIEIIPVIAGGGAIGKILLGIALVALAFVPGVGWAAAVAAAGGKAAVAAGFTVVGKILFSVGLSLVVGGISQALTPTPKTDQDEGDPKKSFSFSGIQNTTRAGVPVPVVYGEMLVGGIVVSAGADIVQVSGV
jgi:predicted phage tail protein